MSHIVEKKAEAVARRIFVVHENVIFKTIIWQKDANDLYRTNKKKGNPARDVPCEQCRSILFLTAVNSQIWMH